MGEIVNHQSSPSHSVLSRSYCFQEPEILADIGQFFHWTSQARTLANELKACLYDQPSESRIILVTGQHGVGKTSILRQFAQQVPPHASNPIDLRPVVLTAPAGDSKPAPFAQGLAQAIEWPLRVRTTSRKEAENVVLDMLQKSGTRLLIIPRGNFLSTNGRTISPDLIPLLVRILDDAKITLVLSGGPELKSIVASVPETEKAIQAQIKIEPEAFSGDDTCSWSAFSTAIADVPPVDVAVCREVGFAESFHYASRGRIPVAVRLFKSALLRMALRLSSKAGGPTITQVKLSGQSLTIEDFQLAFKLFEPDAVNPFTFEWKAQLDTKRIAVMEKPKSKSHEQFMLENVR